MLIVDDFILATIIVFGLILVSIIFAPILCLLGLLVASKPKTPHTIGGATTTKTKLKSQIAESMSNLTKAEQVIDKLREQIELKSFENNNISFNPVEKFRKTYTKGTVSSDNLKLQDTYTQIAKDIYKKEKADSSIFDIDYKSILEYFHGQFIKNPKHTITPSIITKLMKYRTLEEDYPLTNTTSFGNYNITEIEYKPMDPKKYKTALDKLFEYTIIESIRDLNPSEEKEAAALSESFNTGKLTHRDRTVHFNNEPSRTISDCRSSSLKKPYSASLKPLHWGQRKLLLSEIDFFNRIAHDMGVDKFKTKEISLVYPGSAHGHHLMLEMEMYPNLVLYLWDPAMYNPVLYLAEFMRRKLPLNFSYKSEHKELADKYVGRVFINMELSNKDFISYHANATTKNIPKNYKTQWGFFTEKSAKYYLKHLETVKKQKTNKKESLTVFVSDIRLFTNAVATNALLFNKIKDYAELMPLQIANETNKFIDYERDMQLQRDWMSFCDADYGLFKFKLRSKSFGNTNAQSEYYNGDIILQVWAPVTSTETRLFVAPHHTTDFIKDKSGKIKKDSVKEKQLAFYNVEKYTDKLRTFNLNMRLADLSKVKLTDLDIDVNNSDVTIRDLWGRFLPSDTHVLGMDTILETYILYDYLLIYKDKKNIKYTDLILMISDITQTLLNHFDYRGILGHLKNLNKDNAERLLSYRTHYHKKFAHRLDYQSSRADRNICEIK